mmetsp:Transcript_28893/g.67080  ORF Transcript_28893/g.67080 Transcript_28893/m.67080 type:complete len:166 (-) Transcript_28893:54-551(-)
MAASDEKPVSASDVVPTAASEAAAGGAPKKAKAKPVEETVNVEAEATRFSALLEAYENLDHIKNRVKRTGWARQQPGYKIFCCGNSFYDLSVIFALFIALYAAVAGFFTGMLAFYQATQTDFGALYTFFGLLLAALCTAIIVVSSGERAYRAALEAKTVLGEDAA